MISNVVRRGLSPILLLGGCSLAALRVSAAESSPWLSDHAAAVKQSRKDGQPLLLHFYATWCQPCQRMDRETFAAADFAKQIDGKFVAVRINSDRHPELIRRYGITGLPSDVFVSPEGRILSRTSGYRSKRDYFAQLARWDSRYGKMSKVQVARAEPKPKNNPAAKTRPLPTAKPLIGMNGYSPVTMQRSRKWISGNRRFAANYQGVAYWMADAEELAAFRRSPHRFAPRLLGCDPVVLNETDRAVSGKIRYGAIFDAELYFFQSAETRAKFRRHPLRYTRTRHVLRVDDIGGTVRR